MHSAHEQKQKCRLNFNSHKCRLFNNIELLRYIGIIIAHLFVFVNHEFAVAQVFIKLLYLTFSVL